MSSKKSEIGSSGNKNPNIDGPGSWRPSLNSSIVAPCTVLRDSNTGNIREATGSELFKCCLARCKPNNNYCVNLCENHIDKIFTSRFISSKFTFDELMGRCLGNCRIMNNLCAQNCRGLAPGFDIDNHYYNCAEDNECPRGLGQIPNKECVEKNKDVIFNCCRSRCQPTSVTDCQELCQTLQQTIMDPKSLEMPIDMSPWARGLQNKNVLPDIGKIVSRGAGEKECVSCNEEEKDKRYSQLKKMYQGDTLQRRGRISIPWFRVRDRCSHCHMYNN